MAVGHAAVAAMASTSRQLAAAVVHRGRSPAGDNAPVVAAALSADRRTLPRARSAPQPPVAATCPAVAGRAPVSLGVLRSMVTLLAAQFRSCRRRQAGGFIEPAGGS
jgi:hypothetical protein